MTVIALFRSARKHGSRFARIVRIHALYAGSCVCLRSLPYAATKRQKAYVLRCGSVRMPYEFYPNMRFSIDTLHQTTEGSNLKRHSVPATPANRLLSLKETAAYLHICERSVQTLRSRRLLPAIKLSNRCLRFRLSDVERALEKLTERELS